MKSTVSFALVTCLVSSTFAGAQEHMEPVGPIHRAMAQEAARLASVEQKQATDPGWWRVMAIAPRTQLALTPRGEAARIGLFATADESSMTVVYLSGAPIPFAARRPIEDTLSSHPDYFFKAQRGQSFALSQNVRLTPDGVFVVDQKVVALDQVVETIARADIEKITSTSKTGGSVPGAIGGVAVGAALGTVSALRLAFSTCGCAFPLVGLSFVGLPVLGGVLGYRTGIHDVQRVVYRAP
jgi:hypothetical protein